MGRLPYLTKYIKGRLLSQSHGRGKVWHHKKDGV